MAVIENLGMRRSLFEVFKTLGFEEALVVKWLEQTRDVETWDMEDVSSGLQYLSLVKEIHQRAAFVALGFSPRAEDLYRLCVVNGWFDRDRMVSHGFMVVCPENSEDDYFMVLGFDVGGKFGLSLIPAVDGCAIAGTDFRVGPVRMAGFLGPTDVDTEQSVGGACVPEVAVDEEGVGSLDGCVIDVPCSEETSASVFSEDIASFPELQDGYCYLELFHACCKTRVKEILGVCPRLSEVLACYSVAVRVGAAECGVELIDGCKAGVYHATVRGTRTVEEVLKCVIEAVKYRGGSRVGGQYEEASCAAGFSPCDCCERDSLMVRKNVQKDCECGHREETRVFDQTAVPFRKSWKERGVMERPLVVSRVAAGDGWFPRYLHRGMYELEMHCCGSDVPVLCVEGSGLLTVDLPACVTVRLSSGQVVETGEEGLTVAGVGSLAFSAVRGLVSGQVLVVMAGDYHDKVSWFHAEAVFDLAGTSARFWSRMGADLAVLGYGGRDVPERVCVSLTAVDGWFGGGKPDGVGIYDFPDRGILATRESGTLVRVGRGSVKVFLDGSGAAVWLSDGESLAGLSKGALAYLVRDGTVAYVAVGEDDYLLDDGGPSDDEGFPHEL